MVVVMEDAASEGTNTEISPTSAKKKGDTPSESGDVEKSTCEGDTPADTPVPESVDKLEPTVPESGDQLGPTGPESDAQSEPEMRVRKEMSAEGDSQGSSSSVATSTSSSPSSHEPMSMPLFSISFTSDVSKDGDVVKYRIHVTKLRGAEEGTSWLIQRQYEDFVYLEQCLASGTNLAGLIVPPLPPQPTVDAQTAEARSRRQLGSSSKSLLADEFQKDCWQLEKYLNLLIIHPVFGQEPHLVAFLTRLDPPSRTRMRRSLFSGLTNRLEVRKTNAHHDCEEFFQKEREWVQDYSIQVKDAAAKFMAMNYATQRLSNQMAHLATALNLNMGSNEGVNGYCNRLNARFSEVLEDTRHVLDWQTQQADASLGSCLELFSRYIDSENSMLQIRLTLMLEYEGANRALDKAKAGKKEAAVKAKQESESAFEECSDVARQEIKQFHRCRIQEFQSAVSRYRQSELCAARESLACLTKGLSRLSQFTLPSAPC